MAHTDSLSHPYMKGNALGRSLPKTPEVSVVIPCLNEAATLPTCIQKIWQAFREQHIAGEIIVADNGSTDQSAEIASKLGARVVHVQAKGYGNALMGGIAETKGTYILMGDADASYDFSNMAPFLEKLRGGFDLVMGCRLPKAGGTIKPGAMPWLHRWLGNPVLSGLGRLFFHSPVTDFHCGLRAFRRDTITELTLRSTGMEFASEMVIKATLHGAKITEVPITLYPDGRNRPSHLRTWRDGWRHLRFMLLYSPQWLFLVPGMILLLAGTLIGGILLGGAVQIGSLVFDTNTLLIAAMAILVGFNLVTFAVFSKVFAIFVNLLPPDPLIEKLSSLFRLEFGIIFGALITLLGIGLIGGGVLYWQSFGFGAISYPDSLRLVIPGTTALTLGLEIIFSSFLMSLFLMPRK